MLHTCLTVLENASSASPSTEEHLIGIRLQARPQASGSASEVACCQQAAITTPAMLVQCVTSLAGSAVALGIPSHANIASRSAGGATVLLDSQGTGSSTGKLDVGPPARAISRRRL